MTLVIEYKCPECSWTLEWIYDEEEGEFQTDTLTGCPSGGCTRIHEISAQRVSEDEAEEIKEKSDIG